MFWSKLNSVRRIFVILLFAFLGACSSVPPRGSAHYASAKRGVVPYAKRFIGTPYHYGGQSPRTGFDCSGFVRYIYYHARGIELPREAAEMSRVGRRIRATELRPGDLVFYNTTGRPYSHVGIYIGHAKFIHSPSSGERVHISSMKIHYWQARYDGARRVTNIR